MRRLVCMFLIAVVVCSMAGCSQAHGKRIAHDIGWILFDKDPSMDY